MVFSSLVFLFLFLPICLIAYFLSPTLKIKNLVLLAFSIFFYAWRTNMGFLLIFSGTVDFVIAKIIDKNRDNWKSKFALIASLTINLGLLGFLNTAIS